MNAAETIQAAIDKLERKRNSATWGPWVLHFTERHTARVGIDWPSSPTSLTGTVALVDAELIVLLHRTIDAQLATLRAGIDEISPGDDTTEIVTEVALGLACAILGEQP